MKPSFSLSASQGNRIRIRVSYTGAEIIQVGGFFVNMINKGKIECRDASAVVPSACPLSVDGLGAMGDAPKGSHAYLVATRRMGHILAFNKEK